MEPDLPPNRPSLLDAALDLALYAPIGLAGLVRRALPDLADEGRRRVAGELRQARAVGELAAMELRRRLDSLDALRPRATSPDPSSPRPAATPTPTVAATPASPGPVVTGPSGPAPLSADTVIPGYDSLSASQVVQRLGGLSGPELVVVRDHEARHRGRKTVLLKTAQLMDET